MALLEACRSTRDSKAAVEVFEAMQSEGVRPGVRSYTSLLEVCEHRRRRETAPHMSLGLRFRLHCKRYSTFWEKDSLPWLDW